MALLLGKEAGSAGVSAMLLAMMEMVPFLAMIPAAERALKRKLDDLERKR